MVRKTYIGEKYIDSILNGESKVKYNEKKDLGSHLKLLTSSGVYNLDYDLNMIDCDFKKGLEGSVKKILNSSDNYIYILCKKNVVRKFNSNLEEIKSYRPDDKITSMVIDDKDNIYVYETDYIVKLNSNLEFIKKQNYNKITVVICLGNDEILLATNEGKCHIIDSNTLLSKKSYNGSGHIENVSIDEEGFYYLYDYYGVRKLNKELELVCDNLEIKAQYLYIKNKDTIYAIDYGSNPSIYKLNGNLEVVATCTESISKNNFKIRDNVLMFCDYYGSVKLNENLEVISKLKFSYMNKSIIDENLNLYCFSMSNILYKYNENYEKVKEIEFNKDIKEIYQHGKKIYVVLDDEIVIHNNDLEPIKIINTSPIYSTEKTHEDINCIYFETYNNDLYVVNKNTDEMTSLEKTGNGFLYLYFNGIVYTLNKDGRLRRFNNELEEVSSISAIKYNNIIATDSLYGVTTKNEVIKFDKHLSEIAVYKHDVPIETISGIKNSNNILVYDENYNATILNQELEKIASYTYQGNGYAEYYINDYIYYNDAISILKLDKSLNVIATYNSGKEESYIKINEPLYFDDGSILICTKANELIKLNNNLEEVKRYTVNMSIEKLFKLKDDSIIVQGYSSNFKKIDKNLEVEASFDYGSISNIFTINEHYFLVLRNKIIKVNYDFNIVKSIDSFGEPYMYNNYIYDDVNGSLIKYNEDLEIVSRMNGISVEDLIEVI